MPDIAIPEPDVREIRPPWWAWPLLLPGPLLAWHDRIADEFARVPDASAWFGSPALSWVGVALLAAGLLAETLFYGMLWGARGRRLPLAASALVLLQLSMLEAFATALVQNAPASGGTAEACAWLAGPRARWAAGGPGGLAAAFGSLGLLTLTRMALWAWVQAEGAGVRWRDAAVLVVAVWTASHVAQGWALELLLGSSPS